MVQNIKFTTDNVEYKLERFYSPSESKLYEAELPEGIHGEFEDDLKAFVVYPDYACRVTKEREEILKAGLWGYGLKHEGKNHYIHVIRNEKFSAFFITLQKG